jgi:(S)-sulfolactate dehydrogenase
MQPKRVVISEFMDEAAVAELRQHFDVLYDPELHGDRAALAQSITHADALIVRNRTRVDEDLLALQQQLQVVGRLGVGLENIDLPVCQKLGIEVIPATGANARAVAEYVICTAMMLLRGTYHASADVAAGKWPREKMAHGHETAGRRLGIVGLGSVGQCTAALAHAIGMHVQAYSPSLPSTDDAWRNVERCDSLEALLSTSDVVSLHVPLHDKTRNLMSASRLALMKPQAILINVSRGEVLDEQALASALREGRLGAAALDVFTQEPLAATSVLANIPTLILTPHIAGVTHESNQRVSALIAQAITKKLHP